jgi:hypothetical protein
MMKLDQIVGSDDLSEYVSFDYTSYRGESGTLHLLASGKRFRLHHKNLEFIDLSEIGYLEKLEVLDLQSNFLEILDFSEISRCKNLRTLNLNDNRLLDIDLTPLSNCENLETILLDRNSLESIDLTPFKELDRLNSISLANNNIQSIDLFPLATCENLRTMNLSGNLLHKVNLSPILLCTKLQRVDLTGNPSFQGTLEEGSDNQHFSAVLIDALLRNAWQYGKPEWLSQIGSSHDITIPQVSELVERLDWKDVRIKIGDIMRKSDQLHWFNTQRAVLESLDMGELVGLDTTFRAILLEIPKLCDYERGRAILYGKMVEMLMSQLENKGSTHFFDIEKMSTTGASVLIPYILERRKEEIEETVLAIKKEKVYLRPLWKTGYGFEILKKLGMRETTDRLGLRTLQEMFRSLDMNLNYRKVKHWPFGESTVILSPRMRRLLNKLAGLPVLNNVSKSDYV